MALTATAQVDVTGTKVDVTVMQQWMHRNSPRPLRSSGTSTATDTLKAFVRVSDVQTVADSIHAWGGTANIITDSLLTMRLPITALQRLTALPEVTYVEGSRRRRMRMDKARSTTGVERLHLGENLETPFTGKGVMVAVIDQGFEFQHPAFKSNGQSRVVKVWNHLKSNTPYTYIPAGHDNAEDSGGHATHVTGIAAGSKLPGTPYHGMAPEADIVMVASDFSSTSVVDELKWVSDLAKSRGQAVAVNMSFGTYIHSYDATDNASTAIQALSRPGFLMAAAMGNEHGLNLHASRTLDTAGTSLYLVMDNVDEYNYGIIWGMATDGAKHLKFTPYIYNATKKQMQTLTTAQWNKCAEMGEGILPENGKQYYQLAIDLGELHTALRDYTSDLYMAVKVEALTDNATFHAWLDPFDAGFIAIDNYGIAGDNEYVICDMANIPDIMGVGASVNRTFWKQYATGTSYGNSSVQAGTLANFSSRGPGMTDMPKPTVVTPGHNIVSAFNRYADVEDSGSLNIGGLFVVAGVNQQGEAVSYSNASETTDDFYGIMSGTSMATPALTGIMALWLQANPELSAEQVREIIRTTAVRDSQTGGKQGDWTKGWGYGKIDAYAGLKKALEMGAADGIAPMISDLTPVTLLKQEDAWRLLFNVPTTRAEVTLTSLSGTVISRTSLGHIQAGHETTVSLTDLPQGMYIITVSTPHSRLSRKVMR